MRWVISLVIYFLYCIGGVFAQTKFPPKMLRADVDFFKQVADNVHPGFLYRTQKAEVNHAYQLLINDLNDSLTKIDFFKKFNRLIQSYGDLHTYASYKNQFNDIKYALPFTTYSSNGQLWVIKSFNQAVNSGDEVVTINNYSVKEIIQEMIFYTINPDRAINPTNVFEIRHAFTVLYATYFNQSPWVDLLLRRDGKLIKLHIMQLTVGDKGFEEVSDFKKIITNIYKEGNQEISFVVIDSLKTIYLKIQSFDSFFKHLKAQRQLFKTANQNKTQNLIIDVRDNPGGNYFIAGMWLEYFINRKFRLVDTSYLVKKEKINIDKKLIKSYTSYRWGIKQDRQRNIYFLTTTTFKPKKKNFFNGNVYVITNAQSMSTASILAGFIKSENRGKIIGEETGNNYCAFCAGGKLVFELPNTQITVQLPLNLLVLEVKRTDEACQHGVLPDVEVLEDLNDRINNRDVQFLKTIQLISNK